jgi:nucleotide-binding universal stress UspA family protein
MPASLRDVTVAGMAADAQSAPAQRTPQIQACLVPLDGSAFARLALLVAEELADRLDLNVHLLSAVDRADEVPFRQQQLAAIRIDGRNPSVSVVVDRDPAGTIHETLRHLGYAVACLANHGRHRGPTLRPSVASEVIARGHDSVMLAGPMIGRPKGVWWSDAQLSLLPFRGGGVVACMDGTPASDPLIGVALQWAAWLEEPLIALTVADSAPLLSDDARSDRVFGPMGDVDAYLDRVVRPARAEGVTAVGIPVYDPIGPADGVRSYLEDSPAALVVVGAHHRGQPSEVALNGTPAAIVRRSSSPVLVVP